MLYFGNSSIIDLDDLYKNTLSVIDSYRTDEYLTDQKLTLENIHKVEYNKGSSPLIKQSYSGDGKTFNILSKKETRSHAFYRILGLPMTDGQNFFNPGYNSDRDKDKVKIDICNRIIKTDSYKTLLTSYDYQDFLLKLLQRKDISASVFVLSTLRKRNFVDCIKDSSLDPVFVSDKDVSYSIPMFDFNNKMYENYVDIRNKKPAFLTAKESLFGRYGEDRRHYILPLMLDPKIIFAITSSNKSVNSPFFILKGADCDPSIQYPGPAIQSIIIERFSKKLSPAEISPTEQKIIDDINQLPSILDDNNQVVKDIKIIDDVFNANKNNSFYLNFINIATELMKILKQNVDAAEVAQKKYNLIPETYGSSPEQKVEVAKIVATDPNNSELDKKIVVEVLQAATFKMKKMFGAMTLEDKQPINTPQTTIFSSGSVAPSQNPTQVESNNFNYAALLKQRSKEEESIKRSLKYIEYLMGEISGFGICDMFVIISALYLVDDRIIISFLDDDCFDRAKDPAFGLSLPAKSSRVDISEAFKALTEMIRNLYLTMDAIYLSLPG